MAWKAVAIPVPRSAIGVYFLISVREPAYKAIASAIAMEDSKRAVADIEKSLKSERGVTRSPGGSGRVPQRRIDTRPSRRSFQLATRHPL